MIGIILNPMTTNEIIQENNRRHELINKPYNPITGEGCQGNRVHIYIEDAPFPNLYLPKAFAETPICKELVKKGSIKKFLEDNDEEIGTKQVYELWLKFCEQRYKYDFEFFAIICMTIQHKITGDLVRFKLNRGQRLLLDTFEQMRVKGTPIRVILLKARQYGGSTLVQLYMDWIQMILKKNWSSVICAHVKDASVTIRGMFDVVTSNMIPINGVVYKIQPFQQTQNIKIIKERGCKITVGSAEEPDSVRSQDVKMAHFSEVAKYPNTDKKGTTKLIGSIVGTIPKIADTFIVFESTANGVGDYFHGEWEKSVKGNSAYEPVFVPWFMIDMYSDEFNGTYYNHDGKIEQGGAEDLIKTFTEYESNLFYNNKLCTLENINWYRGKLAEMTSMEEMMQDYPSDDTEAFQNSGMPDFKADHVEALRSDCSEPIYVGELIADHSPAEARIDSTKRKYILRNLKFVEDKKATEGIKSSDPKIKLKHEINKVKVWELPDFEEKISDRYIVVYDPSKGVTDKADFGVICVLDRYWRMYGGVSEVVAEWRGHEDKDIAIWLACQIAAFYDNALLIIENNTYDSQQREDDSEFIYDAIVDYYPNLYSRTPADKIREGVPAKYGFNTNRQTKPAIIANYVAVLREKLYKERSHEALNEARWYEKKKNGKHGAKDGKHDDIIMTRMIGMWVDFELPIPHKIEHTYVRPVKRFVNESSF